jgi:uridine phosphorylase
MPQRSPATVSWRSTWCKTSAQSFSEVGANRVEGTSYHYAAPGRVIDADPDGIAVLRETLEAIGADYVTGRTWTTDAFYREPPSRIARRVEEGCLVVEMEPAAFIAVARFRLNASDLPIIVQPTPRLETQS